MKGPLMIRKFLFIALTTLSAMYPVVVQGDTSDVSASQIAAMSEQIEELKGKLAGIEEPFLETKATVEKLQKIKVSGYIQAQLRTAMNYNEATDTSVTHKATGTYGYHVGDFSGGTFGAGVGSEFQVRRGRVKVAYEAKLSDAALQLDIIPFKTLKVMTDTVTGGKKNAKPVLSGGGVSIKDAYLRFKDPFIKSLAVKAGIYDRPFGFEISYSSSSRESPERSRIFQTLFPGERDMGVSLEYAGSDNLPFAARLFNLKAGLFTGNGINFENDNNRDFIGRLGFSIPLNDINVSIDGGVSGYAGNVTLLHDTVYAYSSSAKTYYKSSDYKKYDNVERQYAGADMQLYFGNIPVIGGLNLRGEYIQGYQPGSSSSSKSPASDLTSSSAIYKRSFNGFYGMLVQNIDPLKSQIVVKYDSYDPNIEVEGTDVSSTADMAYSTVGLGLVYHWDENVKFTGYFDLVNNEEISAAPYSTPADVYDNVFTFRIQYKF
jgi:hypothetical protein